MNFDLLVQRILLRPTCYLSSSARLGRSARIRNARGESSLIQIGPNSLVLGELLTFGHGGRIEIGAWCFVGEGSRIWSGASISIGDRTLISHGVNIFDNLTHPVAPTARHEQFREIMTRGHPRSIDLGDRPVRIGRDVLIGAHAIILRGVSIGDAAIVGAGSVVTQDVPSRTVVAGNPARPIRLLPVE
jgi:acetyltransferase-like isoleucine patch superfamily enzyme